MDLHIHTCLSPCGASESVPTRIVASAADRRLDAIAICDHNASENVTSVKLAAAGSGISVLGGMEITSKEEIHVLALFDDDDSLARMQELVYDRLEGVNDRDAFGPQYMVDHEDYVVGYNDRLLIGAADMEIEEIVSAVHYAGGVAIASHVDRPAFGILSQLGVIPEGLDLDAVEFSVHYRSSPFSLEGLGYPVVTFSDAHHPADIGKASTVFVLEGPTVRELREAFAGRGGRSIVAETA